MGLRLTMSELGYLWPELTLVIAAVVLAVLDLLLPKRVSRTILAWLTLAALIVSAVFVAVNIHLINGAKAHSVFLLSQSYRIDDFGNLFKLLFLGGTALVVLMSIGSVKEKEIPHVGEYYYFYLPAVLGAMVMSSSGDLITLFVGLEVLSITTYIMVGMKKDDLKSNEGAFKYLALGGISSATILYGMSFLYGIAGSTNLADISSALSQDVSTYRTLIYLSFFLLLAGFGFKIAAAPFHNWAPDVYQGAPTPVTAFLAVISKGAAFAVLFRLFYSVYLGLADQSARLMLDNDLFLGVSALAAAAMIVGNFMALKQRNMKRLLAYSGVANAGYLLVPVAARYSTFHFGNFTELYFYLTAYLLMTLGAFAVLIVIERVSGHSEMSGFAGLYYRAPWLAAAMVILMLSLAGIPVTGGFFGKLYILLGTLQGQNYWLAIIMMLTSVMSFYYYFTIGRQMFMRSTSNEEVKIPVPAGIVIWICVLGTLLLGFYPDVMLNGIERIFSIVNDFIVHP